MEPYFAIKSILMSLAVLAAGSLFLLRVRQRVELMLAVKGSASFRLQSVAERIKVVAVEVLGQSRVRRKPLPGMAHTLIFFGFLAIQPHSLELIIRGVFPSFHVFGTADGLYGAYLFVTDILAFGVLVALGYALYRRLVLRPAYLTDGLDARLILSFTALIVVTFFFTNAFLLLPSIGSHIFSDARYLPVSAAVGKIFNLEALSPAAARAAFEAAYWIHVLTILGFLVYIPGSKHLHLLAAAPNIFLKPLARPRAMIKTDLEDETAESFGLGKVDELTWKNVLDLYACTECGRCDEQCPADMTGKPLSPKRLVQDIKHDLFSQSAAVLAADADAVQPLVRQGSPITPDVLWACTTCRACEDTCPVDIQHLDIIMEARKHQVLMESTFPPDLQAAFTSLQHQSNPWGFASDARGDWAVSLDVALMTDHPQADILYFVGCAGSFDPRGKKIARALARVLKKAEVNFAILGEEERCSGDVARRSGNEYLAQMMIAENVKIFNQYRPSKILTACPHCFNTIKNEYPQFGAQYDVVHHSEFLLELVNQGRLKTSRDGIEKLAFHDSCYLGRWNGIFDAPRELLRTVNGGGALIEMERNRGQGFCCGAGGAHMFMEEIMGKRVNHERAKEVIATGVTHVATACPFCATMLADGIADKNSSVEVKDIAEIIDEATQ
jgi:Fe-S oxidoreductase